MGVDIILTGFLHYEEELKSFGETIIPLVKEKEEQFKVKDVSRNVIIALTLASIINETDIRKEAPKKSLTF